MKKEDLVGRVNEVHDRVTNVRTRASQEAGPSTRKKHIQSFSPRSWTRWVQFPRQEALLPAFGTLRAHIEGLGPPKIAPWLPVSQGTELLYLEQS
jgi:hypothetical protein